MKEPLWLNEAVVVAMHDEQLALFGGPSGLRDMGLLQSALERPRNKFLYEGADLARLTAALGYGIARNHPFIDGNKRTALLAMYTFLGINDVDFRVPEAEMAAVILALAAGDIDEDGLTGWVRDHMPGATGG